MKYQLVIPSILLVGVNRKGYYPIYVLLKIQMNYSRYDVRCCIVVVLFVFSNFVFGQNAELHANGFAKYTELSSDLYVAALFLEKPTSKPDEIRSMPNVRIEIKVISEKFSHRRFKRYLIKSSAINNHQATLAENAQKMEEFLGWFKNNLGLGDHVVLARHPQGFDITVNSVTLATIESENLFNVLLNMWVGEVPPSKRFKMQLLGLEHDENAKTLFNNIGYLDSRVAMAESWKTTGSNTKNTLVAANSKKVLSKKPIEKSIPNQNAEVIKVRQASSRRLGEKRRDDKAVDGVSEQLDKRAPVANLSTGDSKLTKINPNQPDHLVVVEAANIEPQSLFRASASIQGKGPESISLDSLEASEDGSGEESEFSAETVMLTQLYTGNLMIHAQKNMRYPRRSLKLKHQDTIMASVTIDRDGKLLDYVLTDESQYVQLNNEVKKGLRRAVPYPQIPDEIGGDTHTFNIPVTFKLVQ